MYKTAANTNDLLLFIVKYMYMLALKLEVWVDRCLKLGFADVRV